MSRDGQMGATEVLTWLLDNGDTMTVTVDRGKLALAMAKKLTGFNAQKRATALFGAIVAKREKTK